MRFDDATFFRLVRSGPCRASLNQSQVDGLNDMLGVWKASYTERTPITQFAYCLGTQHWECSGTMQPIHEKGSDAYFTKMYDIRGARPALARQLGNVHPGDGALYHGRGRVQLTGLANYIKAMAKLKAMGLSVDLVAQPDLACRGDVATAIMFEGMEEGWFTGMTLDRTVDVRLDGNEHAQYLQARRIINGQDRAFEIANLSDGYLYALKAATA